MLKIDNFYRKGEMKGSAFNLLIKILQQTSWLTLEYSSLPHSVLTAGCGEVNVNVINVKKLKCTVTFTFISNN